MDSAVIALLRDFAPAAALADVQRWHGAPRDTMADIERCARRLAIGTTTLPGLGYERGIDALSELMLATVEREATADTDVDGAIDLITDILAHMRLRLEHDAAARITGPGGDA